ncbi:hypothetical protein AB4Y84_22275, partial [Stenotrophomonas sp. 2YAF22]
MPKKSPGNTGALLIQNANQLPEAAVVQAFGWTSESAEVAQVHAPVAGAKVNTTFLPEALALTPAVFIVAVMAQLLPDFATSTEVTYLPLETVFAGFAHDA